MTNFSDKFRMWASRLLLVVVVFSGTKCLAAEVKGLVLDEADLPLKGATVTLRNISDTAEKFTVKTKEDGSFLLERVPFGDYSLEASLDGFVSVRYQPLHVDYPRVTWNFRLPLAPVHEGGVHSMPLLIGTLRSGEKRLANASLCLSNQDRTRCTSANELGEYSLTIEPGKYVATVKDDSRVLWRQEVDLSVAREYRDCIRQ